MFSRCAEPTRAALWSVLLVGCGGGPALAPESEAEPVVAAEPGSSPASDEAPCTLQTLAAFDPGPGSARVTDSGVRRVEPPAPRGEVVQVECEPQEASRCEERAREATARERPDEVIVSVSSHPRRDGYDAELQVDGARRSLRVATHEELAQHMRTLQDTGHRVMLVSTQAAVDDDHITVHVELAAREAEQAGAYPVAWAELVWARPEPSELPSALSEMLDRAERAGIVVRLVEPRPSGAEVRIGLQCP